MTVGQSPPYLPTKSRAGSTGSSVSTPSTVNLSAACSACLASSKGNSSRQGTQLGPQKLTTTGLPRRLARSNAAPSRVAPAMAGAGCPTATRSSVPPAPERTSTRIPAVVATATRSARRIGRRGMIGRCLLERRGPRHVRVDAADVRVRPGRQRGNLVDTGLDAVEDLALVGDLARRVLQFDVVRRSLVLVDEREGERLAGRRGERGVHVRDALGMDGHVSRHGASWLAGGGRPRGGRAGRRWTRGRG